MKSNIARLAVAVCVSLVLGCGASDGIQRYHLSGTVTYDGQPVPTGEIQFTPNSREGNTGPGTIAKITNGHYETAPGKGVIGGPHGVRVVGFDGQAQAESSDGKSLFRPYLDAIDLPREDSTLDFEVPK